MKTFTVKDSGKKEQYKSGMLREPVMDRTDYTLIFDGPMMERWARHLTEGAKKYNKRNWMLAFEQKELERFRESAARHFYQWMQGHEDEDHAAAVIFNLNGYEFVKNKIKKEQ